MRHLVHLLFVAGCVLAVTCPPVMAAADSSDVQIDVPVVLKDAKVVFNLDHPAFVGDEPVGLDFLRIMASRFHTDGATAHIVAVFHGVVGYMALGDAAYDRARDWQHGNPYKDQIAALQRDGVEFEECGETMKVNHWRNADLLPGIKVNTGANFRIIQLVQQGYVQIQP